MSMNFQPRSIKRRLPRLPTVLLLLIDNLKMTGLVTDWDPTNCYREKESRDPNSSSGDSCVKRVRGIFSYPVFGCCKLNSNAEEVQPVT